jgi:hypothetical protein
MFIDLHIHSTYSDGTATPKEIIILAQKSNITVLAITDHDTTEGCPEAIWAGKQRGVEVITGIEISCIHGDFSLHMLAYGFDLNNTFFQEKIDLLQRGRLERNRKILARLNDMGISISEQELADYSTCGQTGRPHIARVLVEKKIVSSMNQAFKSYIGKGKPAYADRFCFSGAETIRFIHEAGGIAVLAHPGQIDPAMRIQAKLICELAELGLDGVEVYYPSHSKKTQKKLYNEAKKYDLLLTGGSDYHGSNRHRNNGLASTTGINCPPYALVEPMLKRIADR